MDSFEIATTFKKRINDVPANVRDIWADIVGYIREYYIMDELWDEKEELKFRRSGKTLVTLYLKDDKVVALVIFGKAEREKFEQVQCEFSGYINNYYTKSHTYHDGKWMFIDVTDLNIVSEIKKLIVIKKKPNRKEAQA